MKIDEKKLVKQLDEKWKNIPCPYCKDHKWTVDPTIVTTIEVDNNKQINLNGRFQPLVAVTCRCCGNTTFVNALILNCLEDEKKVEDKQNG